MESLSQIIITGDGIALDAILGIPEQPKGVIAFAHGSGSGRFSPRNQFVARVLEAGGFATLLLDLLTPDEADDRSKVFDIDLLADRLLLAQHWLQTHARTNTLRAGYFGASTGAGAALQAAARAPDAVGAVVSRGGRPDLAGPYLSRVTAPTLLPSPIERAARTCTPWSKPMAATRNTAVGAQPSAWCGSSSGASWPTTMTSTSAMPMTSRTRDRKSGTRPRTPHNVMPSSSEIGRAHV